MGWASIDVKAFKSDGRRATIKVKIGDEIDYKWQGSAGVLRMLVGDINPPSGKVRLHREGFRPRWAKNGFLAVYRDGIRVDN